MTLLFLVVVLVMVIFNSINTIFSIEKINEMLANIDLGESDSPETMFQILSINGEMLKTEILHQELLSYEKTVITVSLIALITIVIYLLM